MQLALWGGRMPAVLLTPSLRLPLVDLRSGLRALQILQDDSLIPDQTMIFINFSKDGHYLHTRLEAIHQLRLRVDGKKRSGS